MGTQFNIYLSLVVCLIGVLIYFMVDPVKNPKLERVAWMMYCIGLAVFLFCNCNSHLFGGLGVK
jgi:hypothetical protein